MISTLRLLCLCLWQAAPSLAFFSAPVPTFVVSSRQNSLGRGYTGTGTTSSSGLEAYRPSQSPKGTGAAPAPAPSNRYSNANKKSDPFGDYDDYNDNDQNDTYSNHESNLDLWESDDTSSSISTEADVDVPKSHFYSKKELSDPSFSSSKLFPLLCKGAGIERPSRIQSMAWPVLLEGKHAIVADQTGSGKTLAYLIPLVQRALETIARDNARTNGAPRLLVLSPTAELADQIRAVCDKLATHIPFKTMVVTATGMYSTSIRDQIRLLQRQPVDVMVSTPGRIATILRTRNSGLDLTHLQAIVLDEVDILMVDDTFGPQLRTIGVAAPKTQFVFCTATLPDDVVQTVEREFPGTVQIKGPGLHRLAPTVKEYLIDVSVPSAYNQDARHCFDSKAKQLLKSLRQTRCRRTLIFCNTVESCRAVENLLNRNDRKGQIYNVASYHNAMTPEARNQAIRTFANGNNNKDSPNHHHHHDDDDTDYILICTDRAARGVDFDAAPVNHVVLFDFPKDPAEYVRRVGRTARAGRTGTCTVFAYGWQLPIARKIMGNYNNKNNKNALDGNFARVVDDNEDADAEYKGGVKARKTTQRKAKVESDKVIKGNIEKGVLWKERGEKQP